MSLGILSHKEKEWAYEQRCNGYTFQNIADALYVSTRTISRAIGGRPRIRPVLVYPRTEKEHMIKHGELEDEKIIAALSNAVKDYENGAIVEVRDVLEEIVNAIDEFTRLYEV